MLVSISFELDLSTIVTLSNAAFVLVPGGFGDRGVKGMILAAKYARENNVPYLGICLGMQTSVLSLERVDSTEFDEHTPNPGSGTHVGSTVRLGSRRTLFQTPDCITSKLYHNLEYVDERHRHRYEVGCNLLQILELPSHPFYVGGNFIQNLNHGLGSPQLSF
ncbi:unnamed protein product [Prunus armeniaca]|uniref:CTP synthase (glutamine hydrolyzing) n=1 Tax=Prunus armeniaca TaxID=36596 RepID=A0A6J5VFG4_PRUAR|nr:unnamed protein product [Prunus armeniaca]